LYLFVRGVLISRFDDGLLERAKALAAMAKIEDGKLEFDFSAEVMPEYGRAGSGDAFELWIVDKGSPAAVVERSGSLNGADLEAPVPQDEPVMWDAPLPDQSAARFVAVSFRPQADREAGSDPDPRLMRPLMLVAARRRTELDRTLGLLAGAIAGAGAVMVGGSLIAVRGALSRGLRPVSELAGAVASLGPSDLSRRLAVTQSPPELRPIVDGTNELLGRLAAAFEREKR